ncbi:dTDP-glucose 4,6-dehydratase [cyanobiont of Ornithocercus magnificus]|nr:dTDP-glucose 4,6-dehydratase [cyanobiont of Ornithocercus magnificus]
MASPLPEHIRRVLVTGGAGFIGSTLIRRLLRDTTATVFNLDKLGYASDLSSIWQELNKLGANAEQRHHFLQINLAEAGVTAAAVRQADPDLVLHLAAESHVDRSIKKPAAFLESNIMGTFQLLQAVRTHWERLPDERQHTFRIHHISTDEVFGSLGPKGHFSESSPYRPSSPYSATKAASDHLVNAWHCTYGLPTVLTNCSNNYGPWQFPEKLIPTVILKAATGKPIPLYGCGASVRDWLFVEDHVDALLLVATLGRVGHSYCIGGYGEYRNWEVVQEICKLLDRFQPSGAPHNSLVTLVPERPGHDQRYAINAQLISKELGWRPRHCFAQSLETTVRWYLEHRKWCEAMQQRSGL